jgi:signal transduction histidine kinase/streptogramin lyase
MPGAQASCLHERCKREQQRFTLFNASSNQNTFSRFSNAHAGRMPALPALRLNLPTIVFKVSRQCRGAFGLRLKTALACCLISLTLLPLISSAQTNSTDSTDDDETLATQSAGLHQWGALTLFHGLPSDRVRAIAEDAEGAMWFATDAGLARYDGRRTQTIAAEGLPIGRVLALKFEPQSATLWVGTETGATRFNGKRFQAIPETAGHSITAIITPHSYRAILASEQGVVFDCRAEPNGAGGESGIQVRILPHQPLQSADADRPGQLRLTSLGLVGETLYVGTMSRGMLTVEAEKDNETFKEIISHPRSYFIEALETDSRGHLWLGAKTSADGLGLYDASAPQHPFAMDAPTGTVTALRAEGLDDLWVGTDGRGAFHYRASKLIERFTFEGTAGGLRSDHIYAIFVDREGVVWFGTDKGVCRYDPRALRTETINNDAESNFIRALFQTTSGQLLCGTNRGLFVYDRQASAWSAVKALARMTVYAMAEDRTGRLLIGAAGGLYATNAAPEINADSTFARLKTETPERAQPDSVRAIVEFAGATYIASFGRGLERVEGKRRILVCPDNQANARGRDVVSLHASEDGKLWMGTASAGVLLFDGKGISTNAHLDKLNGSAVWNIADEADGRVWFATAGGLYEYREGGALTLVLPNVDARDVVVVASHVAAESDNQNSVSKQIWCATNGAGLYRILPDERFGNIISQLDAEQGLQSQNIFALLLLPNEAPHDEAEAFLIGTNRGLARYVAGSVAPLLAPTRIISRRVHQTEELQKGLSLQYPQNSLVLEFAANSSRTFPEQFQYALFLFDGAGRVIKQRLAHDGQFTLEGLRPGVYRVEARAYTKDLVASRPLTFEFKVLGAPFPRTTVALSVLLALTLIALLWGYWQNRKITRTGQALAAANHQLADARLQLANEAEAERRRIARDLHDQTLADLRHLMLLTDQLPTSVTSDETSALAPLKFRQEIESVSIEIRRICEDLSPSVLENVGLMAALEWALSNASALESPRCKFEYEFVCDDGLEERLQLAAGVRMQIYRIVQEALNNICRHARATSVKLTATLDADGAFTLRLEDDGQAFDPKVSKRNGGRGLANIRARASLIEAQVAWGKRAAGGTTFSLRKTGATAYSSSSN